MKGEKISVSVMISCFLAGCLETYDFVVFGFFAPIIHKNYLSFLDKNSGLIVAYLLFAIGFVFRPMGAMFFGHIGDKLGRKTALVMSVSFMGASSMGMCLMPTYENAGIIVCFLIVLIRIIQGFSLGGEYNGAIIYAIEHTKNNKVGMIGASVLSGSTLGVLLATLISQVLQNDYFPEYSWRFAFLLGSGLSVVGYFIRRRLRETPIFLNKAQKVRFPLIHGIKKHRKEFLASSLLSGANNANFYYMLIFVPNYLKTSAESFGLHFSNVVITCVMFLTVPLWGAVYDKVTKYKIALSACLFAGLYNLTFVNTLLSLDSQLSIYIYSLLGAVLMSMLIVSSNLYVVEVFPPECRYSCGALSYSLGAAVLGGTVPVMCTSIINYYGNHPFYMGVYVLLISLSGALGILLMRYNKNTVKIQNQLQRASLTKKVEITSMLQKT
ncbi:MAG: MFS transporter [Rickettsiaceae bacterium]|nr:MFS transporter [Rickettsiaceae bacterium]